MKFFNLYLIVPFLALSCANIGACDAELTPKQLDRLNKLDLSLGQCVRDATAGPCLFRRDDSTSKHSRTIGDCILHYSVEALGLLGTGFGPVSEYGRCVAAKAYTGAVRGGDLTECRKALNHNLKKYKAREEMDTDINKSIRRLVDASSIVLSRCAINTPENTPAKAAHCRTELAKNFIKILRDDR